MIEGISQQWRLVYDEKLMSSRKRAVLGISIFDVVGVSDPEEAEEAITARRRLCVRSSSEPFHNSVFPLY